MVWEIPSYARIPTQDGKIDGPKRLTTTGPVEIRSVSFNHGYVSDDSVYGWVGIDLCVIEPGVTKGEHVARYAKTYRAPGATAPAWAACLEVTDWSGKGPLWGLEVDLMSTGADPTSTRRGIGVVYGTVNGGQKATHDIGVHVLPNGFDPNAAHLKTGFRVDGDVDLALAFPGGSAIQMSDDPAVPVFKFDPITGYVGLWKGRLAVWAVHAVSGQVVGMRQF